MNVQQISSIVRQVVAIAAIVMGALTSALSSIKLPAGVSAVLVAAGSAIMAIEHYVGNPSTGNNVTPTPPTTTAQLPTFETPSQQH